MANIKISQLPAASTITPGTDVVPIVHSGTTQKATPNQIVNAVLASPGSIGSDVPGAGTFTALVSTSTTILNGTTVPAGKDLVTTDDTQTLIGKTINLASNTLTGTLAEFNTACSDGNFITDSSSTTLTNKSISLATNTVTGTIAQFNTACSDADFATLSGTETLSNKSISGTGPIKTNSSSGIGYATGAGSSVTQTTNRTTPVTINAICGQITTVSATATAGTFVTFTVYNSAVSSTDTVIANLAGIGFSGDYILNVVNVRSGNFKIQTYTPSAVVSSEALVINFSVIKSVNA